MITMQLIRQRKQEIMQIAAKYGAHNLRVFGSVVRGEAGPESDLDLLVQFDANRSLFDLVTMSQELEDLFGRRVEVVTEQALHWYIRERVLHEAVAL
ncbi:MAG: nucleotidyltransferase family protein [Roseiflexaceae bacterium]